MNIYDFDGTIYNGDSTLDFLIFSLTKHPMLLRFLPYQVMAIILYRLRCIDKTEMKERIYRVLTGYRADELLDEFWQIHCCKISPWYLRQREATDIVISASPQFLLEPVCWQLGIQHLLASKVDIRTGKYEGKNCAGAEKVIRLKEELDVARCDEFYSDSRSDQPMANIAKHPFLVTNGMIRPWYGKTFERST